MQVRLACIILSILIAGITDVECRFQMQLNRDQPIKICMITNFKYSDEFLASGDNKLEMVANDDTSFQHRVYTIKTKNMDIFNQAVWKLEKVQLVNNNNTFYLSNYFAQDYYLCATHLRIDAFYHRRYVGLVKMNRESLLANKKCMWELGPGKFAKATEISKSKNLIDFFRDFTIWNHNYKEPLYAASMIFTAAGHRNRNVFTWFEAPDSEKFYWNVNCQNI
jgi:hypothetical protein